MKRLTARWVRKAEADIIGARALNSLRPAVPDLVCFHCQQSAEKYLKALMQELATPAPPRTHNLVKLLGHLLPHAPTLAKLRRGLRSLNPYAVDVRYPMTDATKRQADAALVKAETVRSEVRGRLGLPA